MKFFTERNYVFYTISNPSSAQNTISKCNTSKYIPSSRWRCKPYRLSFAIKAFCPSYLHVMVLLSFRICTQPATLTLSHVTSFDFERIISIFQCKTFLVQERREKMVDINPINEDISEFQENERPPSEQVFGIIKLIEFY